MRFLEIVSLYPSFDNKVSLIITIVAAVCGAEIRAIPAPLKRYTFKKFEAVLNSGIAKSVLVLVKVKLPPPISSCCGAGIMLAWVTRSCLLFLGAQLLVKIKSPNSKNKGRL